MTIEREMLELAAKAAGLSDLVYCEFWNCMARWVDDGQGGFFESRTCWRPNKDDGDAMRLAIKLGIQICPDVHASEVMTIFTVGRQRGFSETEEFGDDPSAATRRVILRTAAEIGRNVE